MAQKKAQTDKSKLVARLRRIEGQVSAIVRMSREDAPALDMLTQIAAARAALLSAAKVVLTEYLRDCVNRSLQTGQPAKTEQAVNEIDTVMSQFVK
jgi:DNA-binding FrmR family transcriptional regulator